MNITLVRHGQSRHIDNRKMTCRDFKEWVRAYNDCGIFEEEHMPLNTLEKVSSANMIVTSDLKRSIDSAHYLNSMTPRTSSSLFRETDLPVPGKKWKLKLRPSFWAVIFRCMWFLGYANGEESVQQAKKRANRATGELIAYAEVHEHIVFVGHGFINRFIAKALQKQGWQGERKTDSRHWGSTTYTFSANCL